MPIKTQLLTSKEVISKQNVFVITNITSRNSISYTGLFNWRRIIFVSKQYMSTLEYHS